MVASALSSTSSLTRLAIVTEIGDPLQSRRSVGTCLHNRKGMWLTGRTLRVSSPPSRQDLCGP